MNSLDTSNLVGKKIQRLLIPQAPHAIVRVLSRDNEDILRIDCPDINTLTQVRLSGFLNVIRFCDLTNIQCVQITLLVENDYHIADHVSVTVLEQIKNSFESETS